MDTYRCRSPNGIAVSGNAVVLEDHLIYFINKAGGKDLALDFARPGAYSGLVIIAHPFRVRRKEEEISGTYSSILECQI